MKLNLLIATLLCLFFMSSCKYFKSHRLFSKDVDTVLDMTIVEPEVVAEDTSAYITEEEYVEPVVEQPVVQSSSSNDRFFMIVGSFQNQNLANQYSGKIQEMGYQSQVIESANGYFRVSAKSYSSYKTGIGEIETFRNSLTAGAWLHVRN